jgi:hypothetical protein
MVSRFDLMTIGRRFQGNDLQQVTWLKIYTYLNPTISCPKGDCLRTMLPECPSISARDMDGHLSDH